MWNQLEKMSKENLIKVAQEYSIYNAENMTKEELISHILKVNGDDKAIKTVEKQSKDKVRLTNGAVLYHIIFISLIIIGVWITINSLVYRFYYLKKLNGDDTSGKSIYGMLLTLGGVIWSAYVYKIWLSTGRINTWMVMSTIFSIGWFIYWAIDQHDIISDYSDFIHGRGKYDPKVNSALVNLAHALGHEDLIKSYVMWYWSSIIIVSTFTGIALTAFAIKKIFIA